MEFCHKCGSRMTRTKEGYMCPRCGNTIRAKPVVEPGKRKTAEQSDFVYVSRNRETGYVRVFRTCPACGNREAFQWFSGVSGEHAGVARERAVEHFRCTKCSHTWAEGA
jgi:DNA-directed RNA polymerase subunit M/transcription elongation factor TFIIS